MHSPLRTLEVPPISIHEHDARLADPEDSYGKTDTSVFVPDDEPLVVTDEGKAALSAYPESWEKRLIAIVVHGDDVSGQVVLIQESPVHGRRVVQVPVRVVDDVLDSLKLADILGAVRLVDSGVYPEVSIGYTQPSPAYAEAFAGEVEAHPSK